MRAPRRYATLLGVVTVVALLAGCVGGSGGGSDPRSGDALKYGLAPHPDHGTTFQPDVVLVDGGASAIKSVSSDGLTWTLSATAVGVGDLEPGRVMFLTDRGVGKVAAVTNTPSGVAVTIAPVDLTEVIKDGDFGSKRAVPLSDPVVVSGEGAFWSDPERQQEAGVETGQGADLPTEPATFRVGGPARSLDRPPAPSAIVAETAKASTGAFDLTAGCCSNGVGTDLKYAKNGLTMNGHIGLAMSKPTATFRLKIAGGKVQRAGLSVGGGGTISATLNAVTQPNKATNGTSPPLAMDFAFSVPMGEFFGVPLSMVVTQRFTMAVNIPGQAKLVTDGTVKLGSTLGFSYANGTFVNNTSATLDSQGSLKATNSIAVGISYAVFDYNVRFTVGLGYLGFVAGVFLAFGAHLMAAVGAPIGFNIAQGATDPIEHCKSIQADLWVDYGVGYTIPTTVAKLVNYFLKAFNAAPIPTSGGLSHGWTPVLSKYEVTPQSGFCVKK
jgi:hypothetical protein